MQSVLGDSRRNAQIPVFGDESAESEFGGEADSHHARHVPLRWCTPVRRCRRLLPQRRWLLPQRCRLLPQRCCAVRAEGSVVESAAVAQSGAVCAEAQGGDEDEVEPDFIREQLLRREQRRIVLRLSDSPSALRFETGHRPGDLAERERLTDLRDHRKEDGSPAAEESVDGGVEVRFSRECGICEQGAHRACVDDVPCGCGNGSA